MTPGPVKIAKSVLQSIGSNSLHHRSLDFSKILSGLFKNLQYIFKTKQPVLILNSSGSGAMEAALVNTLSPQDNILVIVAGKFGDRWVKIANSHNINVHIFKVPLGEPLNLDKLKKDIQSLPNLSALCMQACETSTASSFPVQKVGEIISECNLKSLFIVDAISALGSQNIEQDKWKIDVLIGGSQKALAGPAGLSFISFSTKAMEYYLKSKCPKYYWDIKPQLKAYEKNQTIFSSAVHLIFALKTATDVLQGEGLEKQIKHIKQLSQLSEKALDILQLKTFSKSPSTSLTAFYIPEKINSKSWLKELQDDYNVYLVGGQDQLSGKIIRIGHIGDIGQLELYKTFYSIALSLKNKNYLKNSKEQITNLQNLFSVTK